MTRRAPRPAAAPETPAMARAGARVGALAGAVLGAALGVLAGAGQAHAQSERYRPPPDDYDHAAERKSEFWDRAARPDQRAYENLLDRAATLFERRDPDTEREVEDLLRDAIALDPEQPLARWRLSRLYRRQEQWKGCAGQLAAIARADPDYTPPPPLAELGAGTLRYELAVCASRTGDYERAIAELKRVLRGGVTRDYRVHWQLGEAYMALGRLQEAIAALDAAVKLAGGAAASVRYALAVAYDRDEQESRARAVMALALGDDNLSRLEAPALPLSPAADHYYYLGLANAALSRDELAIAYFRHYLAAAPDAPWAQRARDHLGRLTARPGGQTVAISGSARPDADTAAAVRKAAKAAGRCMRATPGLLVKVQVTLLVAQPRRARAAGGRGRGGGPTPGIKAKVAYASGTKADQVKGVLSCVESATESTPIPAPSGRRGQYITVEFFAIAR